MQTTAERSALVIVLVLQFSGSSFLVSILLYFFYFFEFSHFFLRAVVLLLLLCVGDSAAALIAACALQINIGEQRKRCSWLCTLTQEEEEEEEEEKKHTHTKQSNKTIKCSWVKRSHPNLETNATEDDRSFVHQRKNRLALSRLLLTLVYNPAAVWAVVLVVVLVVLEGFCLGSPFSGCLVFAPL